MVGLIVVVVLVGLIMTVPLYGADSRDGLDWRPLRLASPEPATDHAPAQPARWPEVIKRFALLLKKRVQKAAPRTGDADRECSINVAPDVHSLAANGSPAATQSSENVQDLEVEPDEADEKTERPVPVVFVTGA